VHKRRLSGIVIAYVALSKPKFTYCFWMTGIFQILLEGGMFAKGFARLFPNTGKK
jgi:hypothetical protein